MNSISTTEELADLLIPEYGRSYGCDLIYPLLECNFQCHHPPFYQMPFSTCFAVTLNFPANLKLKLFAINTSLSISEWMVIFVSHMTKHKNNYLSNVVKSQNNNFNK